MHDTVMHARMKVVVYSVVLTWITTSLRLYLSILVNKRKGRTYPFRMLTRLYMGILLCFKSLPTMESLTLASQTVDA